MYQKEHYDPKTYPIFDLEETHRDFIRKSFHGGRTDVRQQICEDQELKYIDIVSLYPTVQIYDELPYGEPWWDPNPMLCTLHSFYGVAEIDYTVDKYHFHIIPLFTSEEGRLSADLQSREKVVISSVEIQMMLQSGYYTITKVHRILHSKHTNELFSSYMNTCVGGKTLNSRNPSDKDEEEIEKWFRHTNGKINLRGKKFEKNTGMKSLYKLQANSLWGKFGQREMDMYSDTRLITYTEYLKYLDAERVGRLVIQSLHLFGENFKIIVSGKEASTFLRPRIQNENRCKSIRNIFIASMVTANARCRLWKMMDRLGSRVKYHDTDSIIYTVGQDMIPEGNLLGEWESETTPDEKIIGLIAPGPKTYCLKIKKGEEIYYVTKTKGFTLNKTNTGLINYESMKKLVKEKTNIVTEEMKFLYDNRHGGMHTLYRPKVLQYSYTKGKVVEAWSYVVLPYGFERFATQEWQLNDKPLLCC